MAYNKDLLGYNGLESTRMRSVDWDLVEGDRVPWGQGNAKKGIG